MAQRRLKEKQTHPVPLSFLIFSLKLHVSLHYLNSCLNAWGFHSKYGGGESDEIVN